VDEQLLQRRVEAHLGQVEVVEVEAEVVGHGGDEAGLAGAGRPVEQVPALPRLADAAVVVPALQEPVEVVDDGLLERRVHGERLERGRVVVVDAVPRAPLVHEDPKRAVPQLQLLRRGHDKGNVPLQRHVGVLGVEAELQGLARVAAAALAPLLLVVAAGLDAGPGELDAVEDVDGGAPGLHAQERVPPAAAVGLLGAGAREAEPAHGARVDPGGQVRARRVEEVVLAVARVELVADDDGVALLVAAAEPGARGRRAPPRRGAQLVGQQLPRHAARHHGVRRGGGRRGQRRLVRVEHLPSALRWGQRRRGGGRRGQWQVFHG